MSRHLEGGAGLQRSRRYDVGFNRRSLAESLVVAWLAAATFAAGYADRIQAAPVNSPPQYTEGMPTFANVLILVNRRFESLKRIPTDLISQGDVTPIFAELAQIGWTVADQKQIVNDILPDKSYLVKTLRKGAGREFARGIGNMSDGYDRVERLSKLPHGHTFLEGLIVGPDGWKMIGYLTETPGGHVMGEQVSNAPRGHHFNAATGRVYTSDQFVERLKVSYERATGQSIHLPQRKKPPPRPLINVVPRD